MSDPVRHFTLRLRGMDLYRLVFAETERLVALDPPKGSPDGRRLLKYATAAENWEKLIWPIGKPKVTKRGRARKEGA